MISDSAGSQNACNKQDPSHHTPMIQENPPMPLTLVVATYNRKDPLKRLLLSICGQTLSPAKFSVVVVVDGSTDGTTTMLAAFQPTCGYALESVYQTNQGAAAARDHGIRKSRAERIVVIDDDMTLTPDFLEKHLESVKFSLKPVVALGAIVPARDLSGRALHDAIGEIQRVELERDFQSGRQTPSGMGFATGNVSFPRELYERVGGFDREFRVDEDRELGIRMELAGAAFTYLSDASAVHHSDLGRFENWYSRQILYGRTAVRVWRKHGQLLTYHPLIGITKGHVFKKWVLVPLAQHNPFPRFLVKLLRPTGDLCARWGLFGTGLQIYRVMQTLAFLEGVAGELGGWGGLRRELEVA